MAKAIAGGLPKLRIEEAAARTQARIDSGRQVIVGVNRYRVEDERSIDVLRVDNTAVYEAQLERLAHLRATRDRNAVAGALSALTACAGSGDGNLLALSVDAARAGATVGEMSDALEVVFGRHRASTRTIAGVYAAEVSDDRGEVARARRLADELAAPRGAAAADPGRQDRPGRPRPRPEGDRHRLRRPRLRRRRRAAVPDAGGDGAPGGRERRPHRRRQLARRRPPDPGAAAEAGARAAGPRRHPDRGRRRRPAPGLTRPCGPPGRRRSSAPAR